MRLRFPFLACVAACATFLASPKARANGRFPEANAIFLGSAEPDLVILRLSFGMFISRDRGATWGWACEKTIGVSGVEDPMYAVTPNGTIVGATYQGVVASSDKACSFTPAGGPLANLVFVDLAQKPSDPKTVLAFASSYDKQDADGGIQFVSQLFETTDEAKSWSPLGVPLDPYLLGETVDYAASDSNRVYVSVQT